MSSNVTAGNTVHLEQVFKKYTEDFALENPAAKIIVRGLSLVGVGVWPLLDHFVFRSLHPKEKAQEFLELGYEKDLAAKVLSDKSRSMEVYRNGCASTVLIECPHDRSGQDWVKEFGDKAPYALAVRVEDIDEAVFRLEKQSVAFLRPSAGKKEDSLRQIATAPVIKGGMPASYVMLVERHAGDRRFYAPGFWSPA